MVTTSRDSWHLGSEDLDVAVSAKGGAITHLSAFGTPLLLPFGGINETAACFPLVPFGNRIAGNRFSLNGRTYDLMPNTQDPLVLHGDGWLRDWEITSSQSDSILMQMESKASQSSPYGYLAKQGFHVHETTLSITLSVLNEGSETLPFGIGFHPFLARTKQMSVTMQAKTVWTEGEGHLPDRPETPPSELDFSHGKHLPEGWINNAFQGFNGSAQIVWPELGRSLTLECDPLFDVAMLYAPSTQSDFFCLEPMSHMPNGFHMEEFGGLTLLSPGEELSGTIKLSFEKLEACTSTPAGRTS